MLEYMKDKIMNNFEGFGLSDALNRALSKIDYKTPTPIQAQAIPLALKGHDILGSAQTGTGKTAAFSIPLIESLLRSPHGSALILTPTRELAKQVLGVVHDLLGRDSDIKTAFIIGGEAYGKQMSQLRSNPRIIVGTPGRINDHLRRGSIKLKDTGFLVLDETDRMLDMGFGVQLDEIIKFLPEKRQTLMFSATLPKGIIALSGKYLSNPQRISVGETNVIANNIKQEAMRIEQADKYKELTQQLHDRQGSVIVFVKTKYNAEKMAKKLRQDGFTSEGLHGDLRQNKRDKVMKNFHQQNFRVLVATDIAARGLDVPHIEHVINYDLPQVAEDYIHRMGRTARAGAKGFALSFVSPQDGRKWHAIENLLNPEAANDYREKPKGKNKSRRKPYRGRPESDKKSTDSHGEKRRDKHSKRPTKHGAKRKDKRREEGEKHGNENRVENRSEKRSESRSGKWAEKKRSEKRTENRSEKNTANEFIKNRKPDGKKHKPRNKKSGGFKMDGSAPMKRRSRNKPSHKRAA